MTLESMQRAVCLFLMDPGYRARFFSDAPSRHAEHGLAAEEFLALRAIDPAKLDIVSEGYMGKRLDALASALPRTWAILRGLRPAFASDYLAVVPHPRDGEEETARFARFVQRLSGLPENAGRFLRDLVAFELLLHATPVVQRLSAYRYRPDLRPRQAAGTMTLSTEGPLELAMEADRVPASYPASPRDLLVVRKGNQILAEALGPEAGRFLQMCDGQASVGQLLERFGEGFEPLLLRWLELGVVEVG
ncbi:MAG: hypothetical protein ABR586_01950 [Thermoplasmatota archaeon]